MNGPRLLVVVVLAAIGVAFYYAVASPDGGQSRPSFAIVTVEVKQRDRPATPAPSRPRVPPKTSVSLAAVGDIAMIQSPDSGAGYFPAVSSYLRGNVVLGNLEGTLTGRGSSKCAAGSTSCFAFRAPPSYVSLLKAAGFTIMNNANNHAYDFGSSGQADTLANLDRVGLRHTGRPGEITVLQIGKARVAVLGFAPYPWAQSLTNIPAARALVRQAASLADLVVVTMHAGAEGSTAQHVPHGTEMFLGENRGNSRAFTHAVVDAGADLVVGSGPHVLRGMEWYRGRLIAYSMGNFLGCKTLSTSGVKAFSGVLHVTLKADGSWVAGDMTPIRLVGCGIPQHDPNEAAHGVVRTLSKQDFGRRAMRISPVGALSPPG